MENNGLTNKNRALFIELVLSMSSMAMQQLGKTINPLNGKIEKNIKLAKATLDMIFMLKEKTQNNLSIQEQDIINVTLSNLQLNYMEELDKLKKQADIKEEKR
ncbi:DUF1844 domain-containing protein [Candidatus Desantisbacteria bacterium]|nr:DUF1844 domain-containing protein [Candidatus Desantisbacteria bacterium]